MRGRNFDERDLPDSPLVVIVNQALVDKFFAGRDALGTVLRGDSGDLLIVGIASNAKIRSLGEAPRPFVYRPYSQAYTAFVTVVAKTRNEPQRTALDLMSAARELDPELMIGKPRRWTAISASFCSPRGSRRSSSRPLLR